MALNFPAPTPGGTYTGGNGVTYTYNSTVGAWTASAGGGGGGGGVTSITGTLPITVTGTASVPIIGINAATTSTAGSIELADSTEAAAGTDATLAMTPATSVPKVLADMTGAAIIPGGDDTERGNITTPTVGMLRYNDQGGFPAEIEYYDGIAWVDLATAGGGGGGLGPWSVISIKQNFQGYGVVYGNGRFVMVGFGRTAIGTGITAWQASFSTDGYTWSTPVTIDAAVTNTLDVDLIFANGKFVFLSALTKKSYTSTDGVTWLSGAATTNGYTQLTGGGGTFVASGNGHTDTLYSTDGLNWTPVTLPGGLNSRSAAYRTGNEYLQLAYTGITFSLLKSTDGGASWNVSLASLGFNAGSTFADLFSDGVAYYLTTQNNGTYTTTTGTSITVITAGTSATIFTSGSSLFFLSGLTSGSYMLTDDGFVSGITFDGSGVRGLATNGSVVVGGYQFGVATAKFI